MDVSCQQEQQSYCGDGMVDENEECDDGNTEGGDGCSASCQQEQQSYCGDGMVDENEECDDGNTEGGDGCSASCQQEDPCSNTEVNLAGHVMAKEIVNLLQNCM